MLLRFVIALILFGLVITPTSMVLAETEVTLDKEQEPTKLYYEDFLNEEELNEKVTAVLKDDSVSGVLVVHKEEYPDFSLSKFPVGTWKPYKNGQIRYNGPRSDTYNSTVNVFAGDPEITMNLNYSSTHSSTYSGSFGLDAAVGISAAVGFPVTGSNSVSLSGTYKVPSEHNGKTVKRATLRVKVVYANHSYTVRNNSYPKGKTGTAKKPYGVYYQKTFTYK
ncbi:hypothetical protein [Pseudogracilibacillus auburnensis]|uniref:hypothetical protein n=1 Tax=Pseudogracilibacillus auburnensis TaxID=1494959 RepID=UPI001A972056|nr:hypothetical protein [Pseudogracilibacillus auburnensis]MBO1003913.1 hypothetical protein [Pseudogracilibacillus auburnensis]